MAAADTCTPRGSNSDPRWVGDPMWIPYGDAKTASDVLALLDRDVARLPTACTWRLVIRLRTAVLPNLPTASRANALVKVLRLYDLAGRDDASRTARNLKREVLRAAAAAGALAPNAAWAIAATALREQHDPGALQWAMLAAHLLLSDTAARTMLSVTERNEGLVALGQIAVATADPKAPPVIAGPDAHDGPDPIPASWEKGDGHWTHRYAAGTIAMAQMFFGTWKHLLGKPCDPTLPPDDVGSIYQCYPDLAPGGGRPGGVPAPAEPGPAAPAPPIARDPRWALFLDAAKKPALVIAGIAAAGTIGLLAMAGVARAR